MACGVTSSRDMHTDARLSIGALGSWGAALLAPYSDNQNTSGIMRIGENELYALIQRVWDEGWGVVRRPSPPILASLNVGLG